MRGYTTKKAMKEIEALPSVPGSALCFLAEGFREFVNAQQENADEVAAVLIERGWDRDDAKRVMDMVRNGVGSIYDSVTDPLAEAFKKDTATKVGRKGG